MNHHRSTDPWRTRVSAVLPFLIAGAFFGAIYLAIRFSNTIPEISREVNRVALVPVGQNEFVFIADHRYAITLPDNSPFSMRSARLPDDDYTERVVAGTTEATNGIVAACRAGAVNFVGIFDAKAASVPRLDWKVELEESAVVQEIAVTDDGKHVAIALLNSTVVVATKGGKQTTIPEIEGIPPSTLVWYKNHDRWHLAIIYEYFAVAFYDVTADVVRVDKESATASGEMIGIICNSHCLVGDSMFDPGIGHSTTVLRLFPIEGGADSGHTILNIGDWNPIAVVTHCAEGTAAFMCRCLGKRRESVIILGIATTDPGSPASLSPVHGRWKLYLHRSKLPIIDMAYHKSMGCFVTRTNEGVAIETLPWNERELEHLCNRRKLQRIEQD